MAYSDAAVCYPFVIWVRNLLPRAMSELQSNKYKQIEK